MAILVLVTATKYSLFVRQFNYLNNHLKNHQLLVGGNVTLADIAIYAYAHVADEGGINFADYSNIQVWLARMQGLPNYQSMQISQ